MPRTGVLPGEAGPVGRRSHPPRNRSEAAATRTTRSVNAHLAGPRASCAPVEPRRFPARRPGARPRARDGPNRAPPCGSTCSRGRAAAPRAPARFRPPGPRACARTPAEPVDPDPGTLDQAVGPELRGHLAHLVEHAVEVPLDLEARRIGLEAPAHLAAREHQVHALEEPRIVEQPVEIDRVGEDLEIQPPALRRLDTIGRGTGDHERKRDGVEGAVPEEALLDLGPRLVKRRALPDVGDLVWGREDGTVVLLQQQPAAQVLLAPAPS